MERLTKTYDDGSFGVADDLPCGENSYDFKDLLIKRLGEYEDAEENGLLVRLPCKVGDTVYKVYEDIFRYGVLKKPFDYSDIPDFGKTVFLTQAEAEVKLRGMEA